tara:strand:- start:406 stop:576 length:171 start_codon:yes stop_codon:yes gene_type:complete
VKKTISTFKKNNPNKKIYLKKLLQIAKVEYAKEKKDKKVTIKRSQARRRRTRKQKK